MNHGTTVARDGMLIDWDVSIEMDDGLLLRGDVYRPIEEARYPVILAMGPYGKYHNYETVDPEKFVPDGYAVIRVDSRGAGRSPGFLDIWSLREAQDFYACIEWAAKQPRSTGKVGLSGISYLAMNQWQVAALQPRGLDLVVSGRCHLPAE